MYTTAMTFLAVMYILGLLAAASLIMAWFNSGLPLHVFYAMEKLRVLPLEPDLKWEDTASWDDWADKVSVCFPGLLAELLTCKVCLSFHVSFWVGMAIAVLLPEVSWYYAFIAAFTWPILINRLVPSNK